MPVTPEERSQHKTIDQYSLSIVIPAYNEEASIKDCILAIQRELPAMGNPYEIIVVDDASTDKTKEILGELSREVCELRVLHHEQNRKLGGSLKTGFEKCQNELVFYSDADMPFDFIELKRAIRIMHLKDADIVTGFRHDRTSEGSRRVLFSFVYNWIIRSIFGVFVRDINFSFKLIRNNALKQMKLKSEGSFIDAEMLIKADRMGLFLCQIGVDYFNRRHGQSTLSGWGIIGKILKEIATLYPELRQMKQKGRK